MRLGKFLEQGIMAFYGDLTGRSPEWCDETLQHPEHPWMVCTPDALIPRERRGVDAKLVFWDQRRKWGHNPDEIPESIQLQMWWMMAVLNYDLWDVVALIGEDLPRIYTIERDREVERVMLARVEEWYRRYLIGDERPPIGSSDDAARWLQQVYPNHKRPDLRWATDGEVALLNEYVQLRVVQKELSARRNLLETAFKEAIQGREGLEWNEGAFTWRKSKDSEVTNWEALAIALLYHHIKDPEARATLLAEYTRTKIGTRRIRISHDDLRDAAADKEAA